MPDIMDPAVLPDAATKTKPSEKPDLGWLVIVWNDPVNLMDYVTHVFMKVLSWNKATAEKHMLEVHQKGKSVVAQETFEKAEHYVHQLQGYHLHATLEKAS